MDDQKKQELKDKLLKEMEAEYEQQQSKLKQLASDFDEEPTQVTEPPSEATEESKQATEAQNEDPQFVSFVDNLASQFRAFQMADGPEEKKEDAASVPKSLLQSDITARFSVTDPGVQGGGAMTEQAGEGQPPPSDHSMNEAPVSEASQVSAGGAGGAGKKKGKKKGAAGPPSSLRSKIMAYQKQQGFKKQKVGVVYDEEMLLHREHHEDHPERPERVMAIYLNLVKKGIWDNLVRIDAVPASDEEVALAHSQAHIDKIKDTIYNPKVVKGKQVLLEKGQNSSRFSRDTYENKYTAQAAYLAAGGTLEAIRAVCNHNSVSHVDSAFAIVRPPGHHAHCSMNSGFCFFNNVAVAARIAQKEFNKRKVCIFDWDVHVGDGTSNVFYDDDSVLYISIHRYDMGKFFPGPKGKLEMIGECKGKGFNIQFPFNLPSNQSETTNSDNSIGDHDYIFACEQFFFPIIREFAPDLIIVSAGFDSAKGDPIGGIQVSPLGYAWMTQGLRSIQKCIAVVLEGGYSLEALEVSSEAVIRVLQTHPLDTEGYNQILGDFGASEEVDSFEKQREQALLYPRYSFRVTMSNLAKLLKKQWGKIMEDLIFEKPRRKSSAQSKKSNNSEGPQQPTTAIGVGLRSRVNSMDDHLLSKEKQTNVAQPSQQSQQSQSDQKEAGQRSTTPTARDVTLSSAEKKTHPNLNAIIQVDDVIDESAELERDTALAGKKKGKRRKF